MAKNHLMQRVAAAIMPIGRRAGYTPESRREHRSEPVYLDAVWQMTRYMGQRYPSDFDFARINASAAEAEVALASSIGDFHSADLWRPRAVALWEYAATLNPNDVRVLSGLGRSYQDEGDLAKADESWRRLLQVDSLFVPKRSVRFRLKRPSSPSRAVMSHGYLPERKPTVEV